MTIAQKIVKDIITELINGKDHRFEIVKLLDVSFLDYTISFLKKIAEAKKRNKNITTDWYKKEFMSSKNSKSDFAINAGLNVKTIQNMFNTTRKEIVFKVSKKHYKEFRKMIKSGLARSKKKIDISMKIKFAGKTVNLNIDESIIVINALAVKRAELSGGLWSAAGKKVEKPLMMTLCGLFGVTDKYYKTKVSGKKIIKDTDFEREIDFYLFDPEINKEYKCEVKLMGKGNPESADSVVARGSKVFIANKLSSTNKAQLNSLDVEWVELRTEEGYKKFEEVLSNLNIPHNVFKGDLNKKLKRIYKKIFPKEKK